MNKEKLKNFIELVTFDQQFLDISHKIQILQKEYEQIQSQIAKQDQALHDIKNKRHDTVKHLHEQELKLKELENEETRLNDSSKNIRNVKEYDAAQKELDTIKVTRNHQEQKVVQMTNKVANAEKDLEAFEGKNSADKDALLQKLADQKTLINESEQALATLEKERENKVVSVPEAWLQIYESMRGRVKNPVVPLEQDSCSACFSFLASRDLQQLHQLGVLQCKDCYRFLYIAKDALE